MPPNHPSTPTHRRGEHVSRAVLAATTELLSTEGVAGTRIADVATRAGVHETSIYRRWGSRTNLIVEALSGQLDTELALPDTGAVRTDLVEFYSALAQFLVTPAGRSVVALVFASSDQSLSLEEARMQFWNLRVARAYTLVARGIERGELAADIDPEIVVEAITGATNVHVVLRGKDVDKDYLAALVDLVLDGCQARS